MTVKYVTVVNDDGNEAIIVFAPGVKHNTITHRNGKIVSAGFATKSVTGLWFAHGESLSLRLKSRPEEDGVLLNQFFEFVL